MSTNSNFAYAIHILTFLAQSPEPHSSAYIALSMKTNPVTVRRLISVLKEGGLVETVPGSVGGAFLQRPASDITLADVYALVKDEHLFGLHPTTPSPECPIGRNIQKVLVRIFDDTDRLISKALQKLTIQDVVSEVLDS